MTNVVIASAARTAVGSFGGAFANTPAHDLGAAVLAEVQGQPEIHDQTSLIATFSPASVAEKSRVWPSRISSRGSAAALGVRPNAA